MNATGAVDIGEVHACCEWTKTVVEGYPVLMDVWAISGHDLLGRRVVGYMCPKCRAVSARSCRDSGIRFSAWSGYQGSRCAKCGENISEPILIYPPAITTAMQVRYAKQTEYDSTCSSAAELPPIEGSCEWTKAEVRGQQIPLRLFEKLRDVNWQNPYGKQVVAGHVCPSCGVISAQGCRESGICHSSLDGYKRSKCGKCGNSVPDPILVCSAEAATTILSKLRTEGEATAKNVEWAKSTLRRRLIIGSLLLIGLSSVFCIFGIIKEAVTLWRLKEHGKIVEAHIFKKAPQAAKYSFRLTSDGPEYPGHYSLEDNSAPDANNVVGAIVHVRYLPQLPSVNRLASKGIPAESDIVGFVILLGLFVVLPVVLLFKRSWDALIVGGIIEASVLLVVFPIGYCVIRPLAESIKANGVSGIRAYDIGFIAGGVVAMVVGLSVFLSHFRKRK